MSEISFFLSHKRMNISFFQWRDFSAKCCFDEGLEGSVFPLVGRLLFSGLGSVGLVVVAVVLKHRLGVQQQVVVRSLGQVEIQVLKQL